MKDQLPLPHMPAKSLLRSDGKPADDNPRSVFQRLGQIARRKGLPCTISDAELEKEKTA